MLTSGKKSRSMPLLDKLFWCFVGIAAGVILFSFDRKENYAFFESFEYLMQNIGWNDDEVYLSKDRAIAPPLPGPVSKDMAMPPAPTTGIVEHRAAPQHVDGAYGGRPELPGYVRRYCVPLEFGGSNSLENSFYQSPAEAAHRDKWVQRFVEGHNDGKIPLAMAQAVFAHRCDPGEW